MDLFDAVVSVYVVTHLHNMNLLVSRKESVLPTVNVGIVNVPLKKGILTNKVLLKRQWENTLDSASKSKGLAQTS